MRTADGFMSVDERGTIRAFDVFAEMITGYRAADVVGRNIGVLIEAKSDPTPAYDVAEVVHGAAAVVGFDGPVPWRTRQGEPFEIALLAGAEVDGPLRLFIGMVRPVETSGRTPAVEAIAASDRAMLRVMDACALDQHEERLRALLAVAADGLGFENGALWQVIGGRARVVQAVGTSPGVYTGRELPLEHTFCGEVLRDGIFGFLTLADRALENHPASRLRIKSYLGSVVRVAGVPFGVISFHNTNAQAEAFAPERTALMTELAERIGAEIERAQFHARRERDLRILSDFVSNAVIPMHSIDADGRLLRVNKAWTDLFGYRADEVLGRRIRDFAADKDFWNQQFARLARGEPLHEVEFRYIHKDGHIIEAMVDSSAHLENGRLMYTRTFIRDITLRRRLERRLRAQLDITTVLMERPTLGVALQRIHAIVAAAGEWCFGSVWELDGTTLTSAAIYHAPQVELPNFAAQTRTLRLSRGVGLPGRVWASGQPEWVRDVREDHEFLRRDAALRDGVVTGAAFPVLIGETFVAVLDFYTTRVAPRDEDMLSLFSILGEQIARVFDRSLSANPSVDRATHVPVVE